MKSTGTIIRELRESHDLTKQQLAEILELKSYTTVSKWESDDNHPRGKEIKALCKLFNITSDYLLGLDGEFTPNEKSSYNYYPVSIAAGLPTVVDCVLEDDVEKIELPNSMMGKWANAKDVFIAKTNGESMNKIIANGSLIAVKCVPLEELKNGDIVVFSYDNDYSVKRFIDDKQNKRFIFRPESTDEVFTDYVVSYDNASLLKIHGKVVVYITVLD